MAASYPTIRDQNGVSQYLREIRQFPMLEPDEEFMLAKRWREHEDSDAAHQLVTSHLRLVAKIAMGYRGYGLPGGELIPKYLDELADTIEQLVSAAVASACEADVVYGVGRCNLAAHRDFFDAEIGEYVCGYNPQGEADDTVVLARVTDVSGKVLAAIVNYACHPTTLAWDNRLISPDYPGAMREAVSQRIDAPCVFLQGASGELGPVEGFVGDTDVADRNGRQLAFAVLSAWESLPPANTTYEYTGKVLSGAPIGTWQHQAVATDRAAELVTWGCDRAHVRLEYRDDLRRRPEVELRHAELLEQERLAQQAGDADSANSLRALAERERRMLGRLKGLSDEEAFPLDTVVWRMGDAIWIAVQGEPYSLLQQQIRANFPNTPFIISSIANGWGPSYLPPRELYGTGIYQESVAWLAPGSLEKLIDVLTSRVASLLDGR